MSLRKPHLGIEPLVALVGGGGVFLASAVLLLPSRLGFGGVVGPVLLLVGAVVLAYGLPGRTGALGESRLVRVLLVAFAVVGLVVSIANLVPVDPAVFESDGTNVRVVVWTVIGFVGLAALILAAVFVWRSRGATRDARLGLTVLAAAVLVFQVGPYLAWALLSGLPTASLQDALTSTFAVYDICLVVECAVGVWFAWPWLAPLLRSAGGAGERVRQRHIDSTP